MARKHIFLRYQELQKQKSLKMLSELSKKIERGDFVVKNFGFWATNVGNELIFRVDVISRDSEKDVTSFSKIS